MKTVAQLDKISSWVIIRILSILPNSLILIIKRDFKEKPDIVSY